MKHKQKFDTCFLKSHENKSIQRTLMKSNQRVQTSGHEITMFNTDEGQHKVTCKTIIIKTCHISRTTLLDDPIEKPFTFHRHTPILNNLKIIQNKISAYYIFVKQHSYLKKIFSPRQSQLILSNWLKIGNSNQNLFKCQGKQNKLLTYEGSHALQIIYLFYTYNDSR